MTPQEAIVTGQKLLGEAATWGAQADRAIAELVRDLAVLDAEVARLDTEADRLFDRPDWTKSSHHDLDELTARRLVHDNRRAILLMDLKTLDELCMVLPREVTV